MEGVLGFHEGGANVEVVDHDCQKIEQSAHAEDVEDVVNIGIEGMRDCINGFALLGVIGILGL